MYVIAVVCTLTENQYPYSNPLQMEWVLVGVVLAESFDI